MIDFVSINPDDIKFLLIGIISTVAAAAVIKVCSKVFSKEIIVSWSHNYETHFWQLSGTKNELHLRRNELVIENIGNQKIKELEIRIKMLPSHLLMELSKRVWFLDTYYSIGRSEDQIKSEIQVERRPSDDPPRILVRNILPGRLLTFRFLSSDPMVVESVLVEGEYVPQKSRSPVFEKLPKKPLIPDYLKVVLISLTLLGLWLVTK